MSEEPNPEVLVFLDQGMEQAQVLPFLGGQTAVFSARSPAREGPNQDAALIVPINQMAGVLAIADGAGGSPAGDRAAGLAVRSVVEALGAKDHGDAVRGAILDGFERANRAILDLGLGAATTLAVVEIAGRTIRPYHVGDSTILVVGQRGRVKLLTMSHSPVGYAIEAGVITPEESLHHEDLNVVSNLVGSAEMRIEIGAALELAALDTVLIGSDGLFDNLHTLEITEAIRIGPLQAAGRKVAELCLERMANPREGEPSKPDDLSFILYRPSAGRTLERRPPSTAKSDQAQQ